MGKRTFKCFECDHVWEVEFGIPRPAECTECVGYYDEPQCISVCPVDCVVLNPDRIRNKVRFTEEERIYGINKIVVD